MSGGYIGAIDQGTKGTRFLVFDHSGSIVANAYERHEQLTPEANWVEHDPVEIWEDVLQVVRNGLRDGEIEPSELDALGVTNQRETTVIWDQQTGKPVYNAIVWEDRRTTDRTSELQADEIELIREKTGLEADAYFSATKVEWILEHVDSVDRGRGKSGTVGTLADKGELCFGTIDSWLLYNLTGEHVTDVTNASRTMLYNIRDLEWDDELLALFDIPHSMLPDVRPSSAIYGTTDIDGFLGAEIPVAGAIGDQQAALLGQSCFDVGDVKNTYGTGTFSLLNTGTELVSSDRGLLSTIGYQLPGEPVKYALEGSLFTTGGAIEWLESVGFIQSPIETEELASSVDSAGGVYVVPAFTGMGTPHWDPRARGTVVGLTRGTRRGHIVRATLEAIAHQTHQIAEAMTADSGIEITELSVDGGAVKNNYFCQLQSDILQREIVRPEVDETTALGAAYAAGLAVDYWEDTDSLREHWQVDRRFEPEMHPDEAAKLHSRWNDAVERSRDWATEN